MPLVNAPIRLPGTSENDTQPAAHERLTSRIRHSTTQPGKSASGFPSRRIATTREHTSGPKSQFTDAEIESPPKPRSSSPPKPPVQKVVGKRTGPLPEDTRARAKEMRILGACTRCQTWKITVSCERWTRDCILMAIVYSGRDMRALFESTVIAASRQDLLQRPSEGLLGSFSTGFESCAL